MPDNDDTQQQTPREGQVIVSSDPDTMGQRAVYTNGQWQVIPGPSSQSQGGGPSPLAQFQFFQQQAAIPGNTPKTALSQFYGLNPSLNPTYAPPDAEHLPPSFASEYLKNTDPALTAFNVQHPLQSAANVAKGIYRDPGGFAMNVMRRVGIEPGSGPFTTMMTLPGMPFSPLTRPQQLHSQNWDDFKKNLYDRHFGGATGDVFSAAANITSQIELARVTSPEAAKLSSPGQITKDIQDMVLEGGTRLQQSVMDRLRAFAAKTVKAAPGGETDEAFGQRMQKLRDDSKSQGLAPEVIESRVGREQSLREMKALTESATKPAEPPIDPQITQNSRFQEFSKAKGNDINKKLIEDPAETRQLGKLITKVTGDPSIEKDLRQWSSMAAASEKYSRNAMRIYGLRGSALAIAGWFIGHGVGGWEGGALGASTIGASETLGGRYATYFRLRASPFTFPEEGGVLAPPARQAPQPTATPSPTPGPGPTAPTLPLESPPLGPGAQPSGIPPPETFLKPPWAWTQPPAWMQTTMGNLQAILQRLNPGDRQIVLDGFNEGRREGAGAAVQMEQSAEPTPREREQIRRQITEELNGPAARAALRALDANPEKWQDWMKRFNIRGGQ